MHSKTKERSLAIALAALVCSGCADLTSGGATGQGQAYIAGDEPPHSTASLRDASTDGAKATATIDATLTLGVQVFLEGGPQGSAELTSGVTTVTAPAQGSAQLVAAHVVGAGIYTSARVVFTRVEADVRSGLTVGGVPIVGVVRVSASTQDPIVIQRTVQVEIAEGGTAGVVVDMNAPVWLATATPVTNVVARTAFTSAVEILRH